MTSAYALEKSPLVIKILDMIPKLIAARDAFNKDDPRYKELDGTVDKLIAKLGGLFLSPDKEHPTVMYEDSTLPNQEVDDMPYTYTPTEETTFDPTEHLRAAVSGPLNETSETDVQETPQQRQAREEKEAKEQKDVDELAERWNNAGGTKRKTKKQKLRKSKKQKQKLRKSKRRR